MKKILLFAVVLTVFFSCKKSVQFPSTGDRGDAYLRSVVAQLRDSLSVADFQRLDTSRGFLSVGDSGRVNFLRIPFRGIPVQRSFVLVRTDGEGKIFSGRMVDLVNPDSGASFYRSGSVELRSLGGRVLLQSEVWQGYMLALHPKLQVAKVAGLTTLSVGVDGYEWDDDDEDEGDWEEFPAVVVTPYTISDGGGGGGGYFSLGALAGYTGGYYGAADPSAGLGGGGGVVSTPAAQPESEYTNNLTPVNIRNFFNCFTQVPDLGAVYTVQLCADVPVNSDPEAGFDLSSGSVSLGHSFLVVTKSNGGASITQSFGFYPAQTPPFWNPTLPIGSAVKDNGGHEVNGSITMSISESQFATIEAGAIAYAQNQYSLTAYNCTDYALGVFNSVRSSPIVLQPFNVDIMNGPGDPLTEISIPNSPQGLYNALSSMKSSGSAEAGNIRTDLSGNTLSPGSHGECYE